MAGDSPDSECVTVMVSAGVRFFYDGRVCRSGDLIEVAAKHVDNWLGSKRVELPDDQGAA